MLWHMLIQGHSNELKVWGFPPFCFVYCSFLVKALRSTCCKPHPISFINLPDSRMKVHLSPIRSLSFLLPFGWWGIAHLGLLTLLRLDEIHFIEPMKFECHNTHISLGMHSDIERCLNNEIEGPISLKEFTHTHTPK